MSVSYKNITSENPSPKIVRKICKTTYEVSVHFSKTSRETLSDKITRLIENETKFISNK
ncbi:MAG: transposon-encoded TnpW family protein [Oscillospiraceae bacterium]|nr:transposon-encoded TnpW family protein [Oscillospiraceae bacterium]